MNDSELLSVLALQNAPSLGDSTAKKLIRHFGSAEAIFKEKQSSLLKIDGIGKIRLKGLFDSERFKAAEAELNYIQKNKINFHYFQNTDYPEKLKHCFDGPILFFSRGNINLDNSKILSIVGTRKITSAGVEFCEKLIEELSPLNPIIVSGFAYGVDITAHKAAVKNKLQTIGCLAHGLNQIYPKSHARYISQIEENGGFFTDFWSSDSSIEITF